MFIQVDNPVRFPMPPVGRLGVRRGESTDDDDAVDMADVYLSFAPAVYAQCRRMLGSAAAAQDATQEVFVRFMERGPTLQGREHTLRYLMRASRNVCLNLRRHHKIQLASEPALAAHAAADVLPEAGWVDRQAVATLMAHMDDVARSILILRFVAGLTQSEVAKAIGVTRRTVYNRLAQLVRLARHLVGGEVRALVPLALEPTPAVVPPRRPARRPRAR